MRVCAFAEAISQFYMQCLKLVGMAVDIANKVNHVNGKGGRLKPRLRFMSANLQNLYFLFNWVCCYVLFHLQGLCHEVRVNLADEDEIERSYHGYFWGL